MIKQKINLILLAFAAAFTGCDKTINDTKDICTTDCTVIKGRITTSGNNPLQGVSLSFTHKTSSPGSWSHTIRKIKNATTDVNGNYEMVFHLEDSEVDFPGTGYFQLTLDRKSIDATRYIVNTLFDMETTFYSISRRDTVIDMPIYLPEKTFIKVNLNGFKKNNQDDRFEVQSLYSYGFKAEFGPNNFVGGIYETGSTPYGSYVATSENYSTSLMVAKGDSNVIRVSRIKNGQGGLFEEKRILATGNNNVELTFNY